VFLVGTQTEYGSTQAPWSGDETRPHPINAIKVKGKATITIDLIAAKLGEAQVFI
jgi:hypothetical protein